LELHFGLLLVVELGFLGLRFPVLQQLFPNLIVFIFQCLQLLFSQIEVVDALPYEIPSEHPLNDGGLA
jgi:hypothetical protein